jgi:tetratricopeptide (TPR) repeat protein
LTKKTNNFIRFLFLPILHIIVGFFIMSISKTVLLSTVFSFSTLCMISNTYAVPPEEPDDQLASFSSINSPKQDDAQEQPEPITYVAPREEPDDQLVSFSCPNTPKLNDDYERPESIQPHASSDYAAEIEELSQQLNLKYGESTIIKGEARCKLFLQRAIAYENADELGLAIRDIQELFKLAVENREAPVYRDAIFRRAILYRKVGKRILNGQFDYSSKENFSKVSKSQYEVLLSPSYAGAPLPADLRAEVLTDLAYIMAEAAEFEIAPSFEPITPLSQALESHDESGQSILKGKDRAKALMTWGVALSDKYAGKTFKQAINKLTEALNMVDEVGNPVLENSDYIQTLVKRGGNYVELNNTAAAVKDFGKALESYSKTPISERPLQITKSDIHFLLAEAFYKDEKFEESRHHFKEAFASIQLNRINNRINTVTVLLTPNNYVKYIDGDGKFLLSEEDKAYVFLILANNARLERNFQSCLGFVQQAQKRLRQNVNHCEDLKRIAASLLCYANTKSGKDRFRIERPTLLDKVALAPQDLDPNSAFQAILESPEIDTVGRPFVLVERAEYSIQQGNRDAACKDLTEAIVETYKQGPKSHERVLLSYVKVASKMHDVGDHLDTLFMQWPDHLYEEAQSILYKMPRPVNTPGRSYSQPSQFMLPPPHPAVPPTQTAANTMPRQPQPLAQKQPLAVPSKGPAPVVMPGQAQKKQPQPLAQQLPPPAVPSKNSAPVITPGTIGLSKLIQSLSPVDQEGLTQFVESFRKGLEVYQRRAEIQQQPPAVPSKGPAPVVMPGQAQKKQPAQQLPPPAVPSSLSAMPQAQKNPSHPPQPQVVLATSPLFNESHRPADQERYAKLEQENAQLRLELEELKRKSTEAGSKDSAPKRRKTKKKTQDKDA